MLRKMYFLKRLLPLAFLGGLTVYCSKDFSEDATELEFRNPNPSTALLTASFDMESTIRVKPMSGQLDDWERALYNEKGSEKQRVAINIFPDGTFRYYSKTLPSAYNFNTPHETLPDDSPVSHEVLWVNNTLTVSDAQGSTIFSEPVQQPVLQELAHMLDSATQSASVAAINQAFLSMQTASFSANLTSFLSDVQAQGGNQFQIGQNIIGVELEMDLFEPGAGNEKALLLINEAKNLLLGLQLFDNSGQSVHALAFRYDEVTDQLEGMRTISREVLPSGAVIKVVTTTLLTNLSIQMN